MSKAMNAKTVLDSFNVSGCNGTGHANGKGTIADSRARNHKGLKPVKDPDGGVEGIIDSISDRPSIALPVISDKPVKHRPGSRRVLFPILQKGLDNCWE